MVLGWEYSSTDKCLLSLHKAQGGAPGTTHAMKTQPGILALGSLWIRNSRARSMLIELEVGGGYMSPSLKTNYPLTSSFKFLS